MDGQLRDAIRDIGADEFSAATITARLLTTNDVGPNSFASDNLSLIKQPRIGSFNVKSTGAANVCLACHPISASGNT
jgi:hypothetical protein